MKGTRSNQELAIAGDATPATGLRVSGSPDLDALLSEFRALLVKKFGTKLERLLLFGPHATGSVSSNSDVDVAVILHQVQSHLDRMLPMDVAADLLEKYDLVLAPVVLSTTELDFMRQHDDPLAQQLDRDGLAF